VVNDEYDIGDYRAVGEQCIRRYHARWAPFRQDQTLGVEIRVMLELPGGAKLQGFIDRVARDPDGWLVIHDYKTSQRLPAQEEIDRDRQLALYHAGVDRKWPGAPGVRLVWHFLRFDEVLTSTRTREQITSLLKETGRLIHHVESETDWTPNVTNLCNWCPYWDLCPEKKHQWALEHPGDPEPTLLPSPVPEAEAADRALKDAMDAVHRRRAAEADLQEARDRLMDYARATGATRVETPGGSATITMGERSRLPRRDEDGFERMRAAVLAAGVYDRYADVVASRLQKDLAAGDLPEELAETLRSLMVKAAADQVRVNVSRSDAKTPGDDHGDADGSE
jgi:hypothetical protein